MTYPTIRPALMLDFQKSKKLDPRITFTRSSTATYLDAATGLIKTAPSGVARFEKEGLLVEESRTNDTYPSTFDGTLGTWRSGTNYIVINQTIAPDGTNTGALLNHEMVGASGNLNFDSGTPQVSGTRSFSFWCKTASPGAGTEMKLELVNWTFSDGATGTRRYTLDFDTGTTSIYNGTGDDLEVQPYPNGWFRVLISNVTNSATNSGFLSFRKNQNTQNWYIWGMQSEEATFPTSYIPTTNATVTRAADVVSMTAYPYLYGTFVAEYKHIVPRTVQHRHIFAVGNANGFLTFECRSMYDSNSDSNFVILGMPQIADVVSAFTETSGFNTVSVVRIVGDYAVCVNGGSVGTSTSTSDQTNNSVITFKYGRNGLDSSGYISRFTFYPERVSNASLQELTS